MLVFKPRFLTAKSETPDRCGMYCEGKCNIHFEIEVVTVEPTLFYKIITAYGDLAAIHKFTDNIVLKKILRVSGCLEDRRVTPVFKNGVYIDPSNYKSISILTIISKAFVRYDSNELKQVLNHTKGLHHLQPGFRNGHFRSTALNKFMSEILDCKEERKDVVAIFYFNPQTLSHEYFWPFPKFTCFIY